jgi:alanine racemase
VIIDGHPGELIGRVSMDMLTVDLTDHPGAGIGSDIELWGARLPVAEVAARSGNSPYRLLTGLKRATRQTVERL